MICNSIIPKTLETNKGMAEDFLNQIAGVNSNYTFCCLYSEKKDGKPFLHFNGTLEKYFSVLEQKNREGYSIYIRPQLMKRDGTTDKDVEKILTLFIDWDKPEETMRDFHLKPTFSVETSPNKFHHYWVLSDTCQVEAFKPNVGRLIKYYGADPNCCNPSRLMRLPGFFNTKAEPVLSKFIPGTGEKYKFSDVNLPILNDNPLGIVAEETRVNQNTDEITEITPEYIAQVRRISDETIRNLEFVERGNRHTYVRDKSKWLGHILTPLSLVEVYKAKFHATVTKLENKQIWDKRESTHTTIDSGFDLGSKEPKVIKSVKANKYKFMRGKITDWLRDFGKVEWNEMSLSLELNRQPTNANTLRARFLASEGAPDCPKETFTDIIVDIAKENSYHPVQEYLYSVGKSENPEEVFEKLYKIMGLKVPIQKVYIRKWLIGAVARALSPGCKVDNVLILQSLSQGMCKTSFFEELFREFFQTQGEHGKEADSLLALKSAWCSEFGEIETTFDRVSVGRLKGFLTKRVDKFRAPYAPATETFPRDFILCGTTNEETFLVDKTGNRRYWIVRIDDVINLSEIRKMRDAIWSAAFTVCTEAIEKRGDWNTEKHDYIWWLTPEEEEISRIDTAKSECVEPFEDEIMNLMEGNEELHRGKEFWTTSEIIKALELPKTFTANRITNVLKKFGMVAPKFATIKNGARGRYWRYDSYWDAKKAEADKIKPENDQPQARVNQAPKPEDDYLTPLEIIQKYWSSPKLGEKIYLMGLPDREELKKNFTPQQLEHFQKSLDTFALSPEKAVAGF
ncbi:VapE domain-containing protein [Nostoc sp. UIC 10890]